MYSLLHKAWCFGNGWSMGSLRTELGVVSLSGGPACTSGVAGGPSAAGGVVLSAAFRAEMDDCVRNGSGVV